MAQENQITPAVVEKIADLARLELSGNEANEYAAHFVAIFEHFQKLSKVNTEGVEPLLTPTPIPPALRTDNIVQGLGAEKSLQNAPEKQGLLFKVPPVVG